MRHTSVIFSLIFVCIIDRGISPILAQQTLSEADVKIIQAEISDGIAELGRLNEEKTELESWRSDFHQRRDVHNAHAPCRYERGHAEQCDSFIREAGYLNDERDRIDLKVRQINDRTDKARSHLQAQLRVLRTASFLGCFNQFEAQIRSCGAIGDAEGAVSCLTRVWEGQC
jgi:hypothetical protein